MWLVRVTAILSTLLVAGAEAQDVAGNELLKCPFRTGSEIQFYTAEIEILVPDSCDDNDLITIGMFIQDVVDEVEERMPQYEGEKSITLVCPFPKPVEATRRHLQIGANYIYTATGRACRRCRNKTTDRRRLTVKEESNSVCTIAEKTRNLQHEAAYSARTCNSVLESMQRKASDKGAGIGAFANGILLQAGQASRVCQEESRIASEAVYSAIKLCEIMGSNLRSSSELLFTRAQEESNTAAAAAFRAKTALAQVRRASYDLSTLFYTESMQSRRPDREIQERKLQKGEICQFSDNAAYQERLAKDACEESSKILNHMEEVAKKVDSEETWKLWEEAEKILADCKKDLDKAAKAKSNAASLCDKAKKGKANGTDTDKAKKELDEATLVAKVAELYLSEIRDYEIEIDILNGGSSLEKNIATPVPTSSPTGSSTLVPPTPTPTPSESTPLTSTSKISEKEIAPSQEQYLNLLSTNLETSDTSCDKVKKAMIQKTLAEETLISGDKVYDEIMALAHGFEENVDVEKIKAKAEKSHLLVEAEAVKARAAAELASALCSEAQTRFRDRMLVEESVQGEVDDATTAALGARLALFEGRSLLDEMEEAIALKEFAPEMSNLETATEIDEEVIVKHLDLVESEIHNVDFQIKELPDETSPEGSALETKRESLVEEEQVVGEALTNHETFMVTESALKKDEYYNSVSPDFLSYPPLQYSLRSYQDGNGVLDVETNWDREDEASDPKKAWFGRFGDYLVSDLGAWLKTAYNTLEGGCIPEDANLSVGVVVTELTTIWEKLNQEVCSNEGDVVPSEEPNVSSMSCPETAAGPIPVGGRAIWSSDSRGEKQTFYYREFDGSLFNSETLQGANTLDRYTYGFGASSPICFEQLYVGVAANAKISGTRWDGSAWEAVAISDSLPASNFGSASDPSLNNIVGAYESQSGHAMIVYNSGTDANWLRYSVFDGTWSDSMDVDPLYVGDEPKWFDIAASPVSNEMVVAFTAGSVRRLFAAVWDGTTWTPTIDFTDSTYDGGFAVAFEAISGRAILVFGSKAGLRGRNCLFRIWDGSTWGVQTVAFPLGDSLTIKWMVIQSDPSSNRLAVSAILPRGCALLSIWNGSEWEATEASCNLSDGGNSLSASVAFESKSGNVLAVFGESGTSNVFYKTLTNGSTTWSNKVVVGNAQATPTSMSLYSNPDLESNQIMLLVKNNQNTLLAAPWDGSQFGAFTELDSNTGAAVGLNANMPFTFVWNPSI